MAMELAVLQALEWRVGGSSSAAFLDRLLHVVGVGRNAAGCLEDPSTAHAARDTAKSLIMSALLGAESLGLNCVMLQGTSILASTITYAMKQCPLLIHVCCCSVIGLLCLRRLW